MARPLAVEAVIKGAGHVGRSEVIVQIKDKTTKIRGAKVAEISVAITCRLFAFLRRNDISTYYIKWESKDTFSARKLDVFPLVCVVRGFEVVGDGFGERLGAAQIDFIAKEDAQNSIKPDDETLNSMKEIAVKAYELIEAKWAEIGGVMYELRLEFGFDDYGRLLIGGAIGNDSWALRLDGEMKDGPSLRAIGKTAYDIKQAYKEVELKSIAFFRSGMG